MHLKHLKLSTKTVKYLHQTITNLIETGAETEFRIVFTENSFSLAKCFVNNSLMLFVQFIHDMTARMRNAVHPTTDALIQYWFLRQWFCIKRHGTVNGKRLLRGSVWFTKCILKIPYCLYKRCIFLTHVSTKRLIIYYYYNGQNTLSWCIKKNMVNIGW